MNRIEFLANLDKYKGEDHSTFLEHYGILGQKWGQRRWQNADGTFNTEGKIRYFGSEGNKEDMVDVKPNHANIKTNIETSFNIPNKYKGYEKEIAEQVSKMMTDSLKDVSADKMPKKVDVNITDDGKIRLDFGYDDEPQKIGSNQKVGAAGIYDIAAAIISVNQAINNYDDVQRLRKSYGELMDTSDKNYTSDERLSVMTNKKKIALMQTALATGDEKTYNRLLKKVKDKDKEAVEKFLKDLNEKNNAQKMPEDTQKKIEDSIDKMGSLSKPKINKKYLNEDGTLNEAGKQKASHGRKASDVSSSIFLALRNFNLFELASLPIAGTVLALSGFGVPAVLATALAGAIIAPGTAIDHALYKKLEKRADAYYEMLK